VVIAAHLFTAVGDDAHGELLRYVLDAEQVVVTLGASTAPTAVAAASIDASGVATYSFELTWDPQFGDSWPQLNVVHFGSLGSVVGPGAAEVAGVIDRYRDDALITFDPNWRGGAVDGDAREPFEANATRADVVKLSDADAAAIYPGADVDQVAQQILALGPALVIVTRGAGGAAGWTQHTTKQVPGAPAEVVDTVGAGDAFMAAVLSELAEMDRERVTRLSRRELELVLDFASFVAARTCERVGADPPRLSDLF
jgi:fructokinase